MIDENPQAFLELLKEAGIGDVAGEIASSGGFVPAQQPDKITVHLSYQEQQIIDRVRISFTRTDRSEIDKGSNLHESKADDDESFTLFQKIFDDLN